MKYSCCNGSKTCGLNKIERAVDNVLRSKNRRQRLLNWILNLEEENDLHRYTIKKLTRPNKTKGMQL